MIILPDHRTAVTLCAVSFETVTYRDLECFLLDHNPHNHRLCRIDPVQFVAGKRNQSGYYINLVTRDMLLRQQISEVFDQDGLDRFSFIHERVYAHSASIGPGCLVYPMVSVYNGATLEKDIIVHSMTMLAHDCYIGAGSYISPGVNISGSAKIGKFCQFGLACVVSDGVDIPNQTTIGMAAVVRESIKDSGVYITKANSRLDRLK